MIFSDFIPTGKSFIAPSFYKLLDINDENLNLPSNKFIWKLYQTLSSIFTYTSHTK